MAVSMNTSMRADMMISDAMLPERLAELAAAADEQAGIFAKLLSDIGDTKGELAQELTATAQKYTELKDAAEVSLHRNKSTGEPLPEDPKKLAKMVLRGKVKMEDIPDELITPEFMRLLAIMSKTKEYLDDDEDDDSYIAEAIETEQKFQQNISYMMLKEFYEIIEKHNEREDKVTLLDGISELSDPDETLPSPLTAEEHKEADEGIFTELIDNLVETVTEGLEEVSEAVEKVVSDEVSQNTVSENAVMTQITPDAEEALQSQDVDTAAETVVPRIAEVDNAVRQVRAENEQSVENVTVMPQSAEVKPETQDTETAELSVQTTVSQSEQTVEAASQQNIPVEQFSVRTEKTEKPEIAENVIQEEESEAPVTVKAVTRNENAEQLDVTAEKEPERAPQPVEMRTERVKSATEELEMLKNARAKARPVAEERVEVKTELKPETMSHPLNADQPIVFKRADGTEIEVRPSEVIRQTAKLIETAIKEDDERTEYSITLNPEELGKITVKLTKAADGAVSVTIAAENARTQRILEQHSDLMQSNLRSNGVDLESWQMVGERRQETMAQDYNGSSKNPYFRRDDQSAEDNSNDGSFAELIASM